MHFDPHEKAFMTGLDSAISQLYNCKSRYILCKQKYNDQKLRLVAAIKPQSVPERRWRPNLQIAL